MRRGSRAAAALILYAALAGAARTQDFYWESPFELSGPGARFLQAQSGPSSLVAAWQESPVAGEAYVSVATARAKKGEPLSWTARERAIGPISYTGSEPALFSLCLGPSGEILVASPLRPRGVRVSLSRDSGASFERIDLEVDTAGAVSPRIFGLSGGSYILFVTQGDEGSFKLSYARSDDGLSWSAFSPLNPEGDFKISFLPTVSGSNGSDVVAFQSLLVAERSTYQLWSRSILDGGRVFSQATRITNFSEGQGSAQSASQYWDNQNPHLSQRGNGTLSLVWERAQGNQSPQVYWILLGADGKPSGGAERVSGGAFACANPQGFLLGSSPGVAWSDNRNAKFRLAVSLRDQAGWEEEDFSFVPGAPVFVRPLRLGEDLYLAWQDMGDKPRGVFALGPDRSAKAPAIKPLNFEAGVSARQDGVLISWTQPEDSSGIAGYSTTWSRDRGKIPPKEISILSSVNNATEFADSDGPWYFSIRAMDSAGNWSEAANVEFVRDTTPPPAPTIASPAIDGEGFLASNTFGLSWSVAAGSDAVGYTWILFPLPPGGVPAVGSPPSYPGRVLGSAPRADYRNIDDGEWLFEVAAIDSVGNVSQPARIALKADKFVPYTSVDYVESRQNESGRITLSIYGRGYRTDGFVRRVMIDVDGMEPYDRVFELAKGEYAIQNDRLISALATEGLGEGRYRVGLDHEKRGIFFSGPLLSILAGGTVKYGDYSVKPNPGFWSAARESARLLPPYAAPLAAFILLCAALALAFGRRLAATVEDGRVLDLEIQALFQGGTMPATEKKKRIERLGRRGAGLRLKFSFFVIILVVIIVSMVSVPLGIYSVRRQEDTLAKGLRQRAGVLLESLSASARTYMGDTLELGQALYQMAAMEEAAYVTITGPALNGPADADVVWASNDASLETGEGAVRKLDTKALDRGVSVLKDSLSGRIPEIRAKTAEAVKTPEFAAKLEVVRAAVEEYRALNAKPRKTEADKAKILELTAATDLYNRELGSLLSGISTGFVGSVPDFDTAGLSRGAGRFIFYKPVLRYDFNRTDYYIGMVRLEISTDRILEEIASSRNVIIQIASAIAFISILFGVLGALFLALIVIRPIKSLVRGVEIIRDTPSKEKLAGLRIDVRTRDELRTLSDTINQMTLGLVRGAKDNADLLAGEQDQRELLPLETDPSGRKLSVGTYSSSDIEFSGYYKGATLVSGDYLDFRSLDGRHFAFIKSDVSGHGVSAAMIMAVVASAFRSWFDGWTPGSPGFALEELCYKINDTLNVCDFKGKFATLFAGIIDAKTGRAYLCHAGDNVYRLLDGDTGKLSTITMSGNAPVAGPFASFMLKGRTPFRTERIDLKRGDALLLYTDGIEDSRHYLRDGDDKRIPERESGTAPEKAVSGFKESAADSGENYAFEHFKSDASGEDRIARIVESVVSRSSYSVKRAAPDGGTESLDFDFSDYEGNLTEIVMALASAEKAFRLYRPANATADDMVKVDRRIDEFLRDHFKQYFAYCSEKSENLEEKRTESPASKAALDKRLPGGPESPETPSHYLMYDRLLEDEQYDDITILGIRKK